MNDDSLFEFNLNYMQANIEKINEELRRAIDYLNALTQPCLIFEDKNGYDALIFIGKSLSSLPVSELDFDLFRQKNFELFIANLLAYLIKISNELTFDVKTDSRQAHNATTLNEKRIHALDYLLYLTNSLIDNSKTFSEQFLLNNGVKAHFLLMNDQEFIEKSLNYTLTDLTGADWSLLDKMAMNVTCMSTRTCDDHKRLWTDLDSVKILLKIAKLKETTSFYAYMTISYILDDRQIETLLAIRSILELITKLLTQCSNDFESDFFDRKKRKVKFKTKSIECEVHRVQDANRVFISITTLLQCLYKLAVNDKIKNFLYFRHDIENCLKAFLSKGNFKKCIPLVKKSCFYH